MVEINAENWTAVLPYLASNYEYHDPIVDIYGPDTMAEFLGRLFAGSSDLYTTVEDETLVDGVYMATWTMSGMFNGAEFKAPCMSIVKFVDGSLQTDYSRDYYTEGDIMVAIPGLDQAVGGFRAFYRCAVDPDFVELQLRVVLEDLGADCLKTGMLPSPAVISATPAAARPGARSPASSRSR
mgnify:CR=1 FL=1